MPQFNEAISSNAILWPHVRARWDAERLCLVSVEIEGGWHHDLWAPGYLWADTETLWQFPGLRFHDGMQNYDLENDGLVHAVETLNRYESGTGLWTLGTEGSPHCGRIQEQFPVILRCVDDNGRPSISRIDPDQVAQLLPRAAFR